MSAFLTRVELHGAVYQDYVNLHTHMKALGFSNTIRGSDGVLYQLPPAEYHLVFNCTAVQVREWASQAAKKTGKSAAVLVSEYVNASWIGLATSEQKVA